MHEGDTQTGEKDILAARMPRRRNAAIQLTTRMKRGCLGQRPAEILQLSDNHEGEA